MDTREKACARAMRPPPSTASFLAWVEHRFPVMDTREKARMRVECGPGSDIENRS
jgi:hypothetical protein